MTEPERDPAPGDAPTPPRREPERRADVIPFPIARRDVEESPPARRPWRDVLGDVLRDERHEQGRTLADVAADAHVSLPYLSEIERGRKDVSSDVLASICDALNVPLADVLERGADRLRARMQCGRGAQLLAA